MNLPWPNDTPANPARGLQMQAGAARLSAAQNGWPPTGVRWPRARFGLAAWPLGRGQAKAAWSPGCLDTHRDVQKRGRFKMCLAVRAASRFRGSGFLRNMAVKKTLARESDRTNRVNSWSCACLCEMDPVI